jgi:hypothetical protein
LIRCHPKHNRFVWFNNLSNYGMFDICFQF